MNEFFLFTSTFKTCFNVHGPKGYLLSRLFLGLKLYSSNKVMPDDCIRPAPYQSHVDIF